MRLLDRINGMYAFCLWDTRSRTGYLVRDRIGVKPIYYRIDGGDLIFASELKAFQSTRLPLTPDPQAMLDFLQYSFIPAPQTPFTEVRKLLPGHYLEFDQKGVRVRQYWDPAPPNPSTSWDEAVARNSITC